MGYVTRYYVHLDVEVNIEQNEVEPIKITAMKRLVVLIILCCITTCLYSQIPTLIYSTKQAKNAPTPNLPPKINDYLSLTFVGIDVQEITKHEQFIIEYNGKQVIIKKDWLKIHGENDFYFFGSGEQNVHLSLSVMENDVLGSIEDEKSTYTIETINGDTYVIVEYDPAKMEEAHIEEQVQESGEELNLMEDDAIEEISTFSAGENDCKIRILVLYTPKAAAAVGNITNVVRTAIEYTNESFVNSNINQELELVYLGQTNYNGVDVSVDYLSVDYSLGILGKYLNHFASKDDGYMDEVHTLRNKYSADICVLLFYLKEAPCGLSNGINVGADSAFCIVNIDNGCATTNYSFGHEIGHLLGCRHDIETDNKIFPFPYGHGYISPDKTWRTIMSYERYCNRCRRIKYWSNPDVFYSGVSTGTASTQNNARVWNEHSNIVTMFRQAKDSVIINQTDNTENINVIAKQNVSVDGIIVKSGDKIKVRSGEEVIMKIGFEIKNGADFSVEIDDIQDCE